MHLPPIAAFLRWVLVSCPSDSFTKSLEFFEDRVRCCRPSEGMAATVVVLDEGLDLVDEVPDAPESAPPDRPCKISRSGLFENL